MKRIFLSTVLCCLATLSSSQTDAVRQATEQTVRNQQKTIVTTIISNAQKRLPLIADAELTRRSTLAFDELHEFIQEHPDALECVIDVLKTCFDEDCFDVQNRVHGCIKRYKESGKTLSLPTVEALQEKVTNLVISYYKFQLTLLGALDHYAQQFLCRTQISSYYELAKPWLIYAAIYTSIHYAVKLLDSIIHSYEAKSDNKVVENVLKETKIDNKIVESVLKEIDSTFVKAVIAGIFSPDIRTSADKINKYVKENWEKSYAEIISKYRKSGYPAKPSKESFDTVKGYENTKLLLRPTIDFCSFLTEYRGADIKFPRGYLFEGSLADGRKMAQALAGEMTKRLKASGSPAQWLVYEIHGSALSYMKLDVYLNECLEFGPTVLIINNIDWIYTQPDVEAKVYADVINILNKYLTQESNYPILVCATSQDHTVIDPVMLESYKFELMPLA